jgi:glyoxylase-like metal-dependent hydrolase (beta-lactamase superfamily II)
MQEIANGIYYENSYPGVTLGALILPQGMILIDAPLRAEDARSWRNALFGLGGNSKRLLVNLDSHTDRTLGARAVEYTIIAHQRTSQLFRGRPSVFKGQNAESGSEWETQNESVGTRWAIPDITFTQRVSIHWGQPEVVLEHHPGPAAGAIWAIIPSERVLFVGDAVLANQPAFLATADIPSWLETLDVLQNSYQDYTIVSGRGGPIPFSEVKTQRIHLKHALGVLERLAQKNVPSEATESLIPTLLADFKFPAKLEEQYTQRLHHGLYQYYAHHYRPLEASEQI